MTDLQRIPHVYTEAWELLQTKGTTNRGTGRSTGKPTSRPPGGTDRQLRSCVVDCARAISDATWHLGHHSLPTKPWRPLSFTTEVRGRRRLVVDLGIAWREIASRVTCSGCGAVWAGADTPHTPACKGRPEEHVTLWIADRWAPAGDDLSITVPHPHQIRGVCSRLTGNLGLLGTKGLVDYGDDPDPHVVSAMRAVRRAKGALVRGGLWEPPRMDIPKRCKRAGCIGDDGNPRPLVNSDGPVCRACRKRDERERKAC